MILLIKLIIVITAALVVVYFTLKREKGKISPYIVGVIIVVIYGVADHIIDILMREINDPKVQVICEKPTEGALTLNIKKKNKSVRTLDINFPVLGKIDNIQEFSQYNIDRKMVSKLVVGKQIVDSQNNVQISIEDISATADIKFKIPFTPMSSHMKETLVTKLKLSRMLHRYPIKREATTAEQMLWLDCFSYRYTYSHGGHTIEKRKYISIDTNKEVPPPPYISLGFYILPHAMTAEEAKQDYERGIPVHEFK